MLTIDVPGREPLALEHLVLDLNGTLTHRGRLLAGLEGRIGALRVRLAVHFASADTFGTLDEVARQLGAHSSRVVDGEAKLELIRSLCADRCVMVGNGANDVLALREAALGIAVLGPEGTAADALAAADVVCRSPAVALDLLIEPKKLQATLRR